MLGSQVVEAQSTNTSTPISLNAAYNLAIQNNLQLRGSGIQLEQSRTLAKTGFDIPRTGLFVENEDLSSLDSKGILKIGLSQSIEWPGLYSAKKDLLKQQVTSVELAGQIKAAEIKRDLELIYYNLWYLQNKQQLWTRLDSLYSSFAKAAVLRVRTGESAGLDSISAQAKAKETKLQLQLLDKDIRTGQAQLKRLLNTDKTYLPEPTTLPKINIISNATDFSEHPEIKWQQQNVALADAEVRVSKQKGMPSFEGRFFSQHLYGTSPGYSGFSVSMGIPVFGRSVYRNTVKAAELEKDYQQSLTDYNILSINSSYLQITQQMEKNNDLINYYQQTGIAQAEAIIKAANLSYQSGEISFAELSQFLTQAIDIQRNYLDVLNDYNQSAIQLNYFIKRN